jgi:hypothetical protein
MWTQVFQRNSLWILTYGCSSQKIGSWILTPARFTEKLELETSKTMNLIAMLLLLGICNAATAWANHPSTKAEAKRQPQ